MRLRRFAVLSATLVLAACLGPGEATDPNDGPTAASPDAEQPLIPLEALFAPTRYSAPKVSPDGRWLSWIEPVDGINNFFVASTADLSQHRQLTFKMNQGVRPADVSGVVMYRWSADSRFIVYPHDHGGDENWDLWRIDVERGEEENLTPSPERSWQIVGTSRRRPGTIAATEQTFGQQDGVLYRLDLETGGREEVLRASDGIVGVLVDEELEPVVAVAAAGASDFAYLRRNGDGWETLLEIAADDLGALSAASYQKVLRLGPEGRRFYTYSSAGRDTAALVELDLATGAVREIAADPRVDIGGVLYHPRTVAPLAYAANWKRLRWTAIDEAVSPDLARIAAEHPDGDFTLLDQSDDGELWVVRYDFPDGPTRYHLYDRSRRTLTEIGVASPELLGMRLSRMHPTILDSSDGLPLVSYYSLPVGTDPDGDGVPHRPLPTVMLVHGGPGDERATYAFAPFVQWLNNRGYVVYNLNYRGSAGFGKAYSLAANGEWGGKMHRDLLEQLDALVERGVIDRERVAILGGSYGGYATLVGMTMTPEVFACGVDLVGPSNLEIPMPHWRPERMAVFLGGDPRTEEGRAFLRSISPVTHAHRTRGAVLIGQGANDSRVPQEQSDQIVQIMKGAGAEVVYAVYDDEGHGFQRQENRMSFWAIAEVFLGRCLGGRHQPLGDALAGSSLRVPVGAEHVPGLEEALASRERAEVMGR